MTWSANFTSKSVFDQQGCRALTFALARLSCYLTSPVFQHCSRKAGSPKSLPSFSRSYCCTQCDRLLA